MMQRSRVWRIAIPLFFFINVAGAGFAIAGGELMHAGAHIGLVFLALAVLGIRRIRPQSERQEEPSLHPAEEILDKLQQSVDSIALEVERIGEAQRFNAKILGDRVALKSDDSKA